MTTVHTPGFQIQRQDSYLKSARLCPNTHIGNIEQLAVSDDQERLAEESAVGW